LQRDESSEDGRSLLAQQRRTSRRRIFKAPLSAETGGGPASERAPFPLQGLFHLTWASPALSLASLTLSPTPESDDFSGPVETVSEQKYVAASTIILLYLRTASSDARVSASSWSLKAGQPRDAHVDASEELQKLLLRYRARIAHPKLSSTLCDCIGEDETIDV
jgi:hypothetical protein